MPKLPDTLTSKLTDTYLASISPSQALSFTHYTNANDNATASLFQLINTAYAVENNFKCACRFVSISEFTEYLGEFACLMVRQNISDNEWNGNEDVEQQAPLIACVCLQQDPYIENAMYFGSLAIDPEYQAQGIGSKIISLIEKIALDFNMRYVTLDAVDIRTTLVQYYQKRGFVQYNSRVWATEYEHLLREEWRGGKVNFVMMRKAVDAEDEQCDGKGS